MMGGKASRDLVETAVRMALVATFSLIVVCTTMWLLPNRPECEVQAPAGSFMAMMKGPESGYTPELARAVALARDGNVGNLLGWAEANNLRAIAAIGVSGFPHVLIWNPSPAESSHRWDFD